MNTTVLIAWSPTSLGSIAICSPTLILSANILAAGDEVVGGELKATSSVAAPVSRNAMEKLTMAQHI